MKFQRTAYGRIARTSSSPAWINCWVRTGRGWQLEVLWNKRGRWISDLWPAERTLKVRAFEPSTPNVKSLGTESRRFEIRNLADLSPLVEPRELLGPMLPGAALSDRHAIYVAQTDTKPLYLPALLLIERLWLWSREALKAIFIPNSLDVLLGAPAATDDGIQVTIDPRLASRTPSDTALRAIAWLTQSPHARASWSSVLANAYSNRIDLVLPHASMSGWAWGLELPSGYLACELLSLQLNFELTEPLPQFRIGKVLHQCPQVPSERLKSSAHSSDTQSRHADTHSEHDCLRRHLT